MTAADSARSLLVADSFRVRGQGGRAEVRGFSEHLQRFAGTVREALLADLPGTAADRLHEQAAAAGVPQGESGSDAEVFAVAIELPEPEEARLAAFLADAIVQIAAFGAGFPRLEMWREADGATSYRLALRTIPELGETLALRTAPGVTLAHPDRKGPNIAVLGALNRELGAEALLLDARGRVLEGATTSLIYWIDPGPESGHIVAESGRVRSVTESLLMGAAQHRFVGDTPHRRRSGAFATGSPTPALLQGCEVWAVNALHGIRTVSHLDGVALPGPEPHRLAWFRQALDRTWEPVTG